MRDLSSLAWRKSSYSSAGGNCVETAVLPSDRVAVRDSKDPGGGILVLPAPVMTAWVASVKAGIFDLAAG
jgi:hypothetical protein